MYDFCLVDFGNIKIGWMFVEYNGVLVIGENCKKSFMNIMLNPLNGKKLYFNFCNFRYIVANKVQPIIDISSIMMNWILGHTSMNVLGWVLMLCLSIDNFNKIYIVVPLINIATFAFQHKDFVDFLLLKNNLG
jgi:hypothetical protein